MTIRGHGWAATCGAALALAIALAPVDGRAARPEALDTQAVRDLTRAETLIELGAFDEAVSILEQLADRGFVQAAVRLADLLYGEVALSDAPLDTPEQRRILDLAIGFYEQAASVDGRHYDQATRRLARLLLLRAATPDEVDGAIERLRGLVVLGNAHAARDIAEAHLLGRGVRRDYAQADRYLRLALDMGEYGAARLLGTMALFGMGRRASSADAAEYLQLAVDNGDFRAARILAEVYGDNLDDGQAALVTVRAEVAILEGLYAEDPRPAYAMRLAEIHLRDPYHPIDETAGIAWLTRAADTTGLAAFRLFQITGEPSFGPYDPEAARGHAQQVIDAGYWAAIPTIAHYYLDRACTAPADAGRALDWLEQAAEAGDSDAMGVLSAALGGGWSCVAGDEQAARRWRLAAARGGWGTNDDVLDLGRAAVKDVSDPVAAEYGLAMIEVAAERGSVAARTDLGVWLIDNAPSEQAFRRGLSILRAVAAEAASTRAMVRLGNALLYSTDPTERAEALAWLQRAAGYDRPEALRILGRAWLEGMVVPRDPDRAEQTLQRALAYGDAEAGLVLADLYMAGGGLDLGRAHAAIAAAAALGSPEAMIRLAGIYRFGIGVAPEPERADALLRQAAAAGSAEARGLLDDTGPDMPDRSNGPSG